MEPPAGGVNYENEKIALNYGYENDEGALFISFPTHNTKFVAKQENRYLIMHNKITNLKSISSRLMG